jgi:flagellar biosynthetic protein FliR
VTALEGLLRSELAIFLLECARISGVIIVAPLAWANAPARVKLTLVLMLAVVAHGLSDKTVAPSSMFDTGIALSFEMMVGVAMGFVVRLVVAIAEMVGEIVSPAIGLGVATSFDPTTHAQQNIITSILRYFIVFIALIVGVHRIVLGGLLAGFRLLPVGTVTSLRELLPTFIEMSSRAIEAGVRIALPIIAILYMTQIALAFVARAAPQMQVFNVGFAVMLAVGLFLLGSILPDTNRGFLIELSQIGPRIESIFGALGATL